MRFEALDAWRGLAAVMVVLVHLSYDGLFYAIPAVRNGGVAVPLFFVLSGFVVTFAYGARLETWAQGRTFIQRRFGRIYPLHFVTLMAVIGLEVLKLLMTSAGVSAGQAPFAGTNSLESLAANFVLLQAIIPFGYFSWNGPSWSISVEWACYLVFACVHVLAGRRAETWGAILCVCFGAVFLAIELSGVDWHTMSGKGLLLALFGFFSGGLVLRAYRYLSARGWKGGTLSELAAAVLVGILFWFDQIGGFLVVVGFASVILVFAFQGGAISRLLLERFPQFLGRISYSIYMVHFVVIAVVSACVRVWQSQIGQVLIQDELISFGPPGLMDAMALAVLALTVLVAWGTYVWVEVPGRTFFNALSDRKPIGQAWRAALADVFPAPAR